VIPWDTNVSTKSRPTAQARNAIACVFAMITSPARGAAAARSWSCGREKLA
jgi:hypothetical protein